MVNQANLEIENIIEQYDNYVTANKSRLKWQAFINKYNAVSRREKAKMLIKLILRCLGVNKHFFLGGYRFEEDFKQRLQDFSIYCKLMQKTKQEDNFRSNNTGKLCNEYCATQTGEAENKLRTLLREHNSYIALVAENLNLGGLEEVVQTLAVEYFRREIPVKVLCIYEGGHVAERLSHKGIEVIIFHGNKKKLDKYIRNNRPLLANTHYVISYLDVFKKYNVPIVEVIHNMYVFLPQDRIQQEVKKAELITRYVAVSHMAKTIFQQKCSKIDSEKIDVIGNAAYKSALVFSSGDIVRKAYKIDNNTFVFISVGSIDARKNQIGILRAWDIFCKLIDGPAVLILAGESSDNVYEEKLKKLIYERKCDNSVILTGYYSPISDVLNISNALIMNSYYEGWSMAATEALHCGIPVIHSMCGSGMELVAEGKNGILIDNPLKDIGRYESAELYDAMHAGINHNVEQLVRAMLDIYKHRNEWKERRELIIQYAECNFNLAKMIDQYTVAYLTACTESDM